MSDSPAPASEVWLTNGQVIAVTQSLDAILGQRHQMLAGVPVVRLIREDGRPVYVAAGHLVVVGPVAPPAEGRAH